MFLIIMCVGGLMIFGSVIAWTSNTSEGCSVFIWLLSTGFALLFGSLFAKNARIYMLFSNRSLQVVKYSDRDIAVGVVCLVAGEWALVIAGQIVQPPNYEFVNYGNVQYSFCIFHVPTGITLLVYNVCSHSLNKKKLALVKCQPNVRRLIGSNDSCRRCNYSIGQQTQINTL